MSNPYGSEESLGTIEQPLTLDDARELGIGIDPNDMPDVQD